MHHAFTPTQNLYEVSTSPQGGGRAQHKHLPLAGRSKSLISGGGGAAELNKRNSRTDNWILNQVQDDG